MFVFSFYLFILILFYLFSTTFAPKINNRYMRRIVLGLFAAIAVCSCSEKKSASTRLQENVSKAPTRVMTELVGGQESQTSNLQSHASVPYVGIVEEREATAVSFTGMGVVKRVLVNETARSAVCKINIDSDLRLGFTAGIRQTFIEHPELFDPRGYLKPARQNVKDIVKHKIVDVLGSAGKA